MFTIYCHTNRRNGKAYVGWTSSTMEKRWRGHIVDVLGTRRSTALFHKALRKWGTGDDVWQHEVIVEVATKEEALTAEKLWIAQRRTHAYSDGHHGYNQTLGGEGVAGTRDTLETRKRKSESQRRRHRDQPLSFETRSQARKKCPPPGVQTRQRMSLAKQKPVAQCDMDGNVLKVWPSPKLVESSLKPQQVARAARNDKPYAGYRWRYV